jgi:hypothetical protein
MIKYINEPVPVETKTRQDGTLLPTAFTWRKQTFIVTSWGRESFQDREGQSIHCYLVQTSDLTTWELCWNKSLAQWVLSRHWASEYRIV